MGIIKVTLRSSMFIQITDNFLIAVYLIQTVTCNANGEHGWVTYTDNREPDKTSTKKITPEDYARICKYLLRLPAMSMQQEIVEN
jgi:hypothetical protein